MYVCPYSNLIAGRWMEFKFFQYLIQKRTFTNFCFHIWAPLVWKAEITGIVTQRTVFVSFYKLKSHPVYDPSLKGEH